MAKRSRTRSVAVPVAEVDNSVEYVVKPMTRASEAHRTPLSDASCVFVIGYIEDGGKPEARRWCLSSLE